MLYDEKGYEVKIEISPTYNPCAAGVSDDKRDLGVNLRYIGADKPEHIAVSDSYTHLRAHETRHELVCRHNV